MKSGALMAAFLDVVSRPQCVTMQNTTTRIVLSRCGTINLLVTAPCPALVVLFQRDGDGGALEVVDKGALVHADVEALGKQAGRQIQLLCRETCSFMLL